MKRSTVRLVVTPALSAAAFVLAFGACDAPGVPAASTPRAFAKDEDLAGDWERQWDLRIKDAVKEYEKLAKWCMENALEQTGNLVRRGVLKYSPDDPDVRAYLGYVKGADGRWEVDEARRDRLRAVVDLDDPHAGGFKKKRDAMEKRIATAFKGLAQKAKKGAEADPAGAAAWKERETKAWRRVLQVVSDNEEAHKALGHPKFEGKFVLPEALPYLEVRSQRRRAGEKTAATNPKVEPVEMDGRIVKAGLQGGGAKSEHFVVNTVHGKEVALRVAQWGERALEDIVLMYGFPADVRDRLFLKKMSMVKDKDELKAYLSKGAGWNERDVGKFVEHFGGSNLEGGTEHFSTVSAGRDSDDMMIHQVGHAAAHAARGKAIGDLGSPSPDLETWLQECISYDMTRRLTGTTLTTCGAFGKYGKNFVPKPGQDEWIELAKILVETDDDVPLKRLYTVTLVDQTFRGPETVKGYAFIQFVFETDPEKGQKFIWHAVAQGTPAATEAVYGISMDELDAQYRDWILKSH